MTDTNNNPFLSDAAVTEMFTKTAHTGRDVHSLVVDRLRLRDDREATRELLHAAFDWLTVVDPPHHTPDGLRELTDRIALALGEAPPYQRGRGR